MGAGAGAGAGAGVAVEEEDTKPQSQPLPYPELFEKGTRIEVGTHEEGFAGSWYIATVLDLPSRPPPPPFPGSNNNKKNKKTTTTPPHFNKYLVEYEAFVDDQDGTPLKEFVNVDLARPLPPLISVPSFHFNDLVDGFYRDGWWTGVITKLLPDSRFLVTFQNPPDQIEFGSAELRIHLDWVHGKWVQPNQGATGWVISTGKEVEVSFKRDDSYEVWFPATVIDNLLNNSYVVQYWNRNGNAAALQKVTVDSLHIRPPPPQVMNRSFDLLEKVDAFYDFGWCSGVITRELANEKYIILLKHINKKMEFSKSELRPHMEWIDGKWMSGSEAVINPPDHPENVDFPCNASESVNNTPLITQIASPDARKEKSEERSPSMNLKKNQNEQSSGWKGKPSSNGLASQRKNKKQNPDNDTSHSRPSKKSKKESAPETPTSTACQIDARAMKSSSNGNSSLKTESHSSREKVNTQEKVGELDIYAKKPVRRRGRWPKLQVKSSQYSTRDNKSDAGVGTAQGSDEKVCKTEEIAPILLGLAACNGMRSPQEINLHQSPGEGSQISILDLKDQGNDSVSHNIEEKNQSKSPEDSSKRRRGRPPKVVGKSRMIKLPISVKDKVVSSSDQLEKPRTKKMGKRSANSSIESPVSTINDSPNSSMGKRDGGDICENHRSISDNQPLSMWFDGVNSQTDDGSRVVPKRVVQDFSKVNEKNLELAVHTVAIDSNAGIDLDESLPFVKTIRLWETIESMEVFQVMPQKPHFSPLERCKENCREGSAIGYMVTFASVVKKIAGLQIDEPRSSIEECMENLVELECNGFDVKIVRDRLTGLLLKKDEQELLQNDLKEQESRIVEHDNEKTKIDEEIEEIDKKILELQEKRAEAMSKREMKDAEVTVVQSIVGCINDGMKSNQRDFEELAAAPW